MTENIPATGELVSKANAFVRENRQYFRDYMKPVVVPYVLFNMLANVGMYWSKGFSLFGLVAAYFSACFILAWHRTVLLGPKNSHAVNPFSLKKGEGRFIAAFFGISIIPVCLGALGAIPVVVMAARHSPMTGVAAVVALVIIVYAIFLTLRYIFILPARSVNVEISLREACEISRGLVWKLFASAFRLSIWWVILIILWAVFVGAIIGYVLDMPQDSLESLMITFVCVQIPSLLIHFLIAARFVTVLSWLYQWSVQNRPQRQKA